jgi:hypothetical protein
MRADVSVRVVAARKLERRSTIKAAGHATVRTFAQQLKHAAADNYMLGAAILGEKPPADETDRIRCGQKPMSSNT